MTQESASATAVVLRDFAARFGGDPESIVRAPGRVNLIGEHTDYNDGYVLPLAIDPAIWIGLRARSDRTVRAWSVDFHEPVEFDVDELSPNAGQAHGWGEYVKGVAWALREAGHTLNGWEGAIAGEVPIGAGLSSSAAIEVAAARAFADVSALPWDPTAAGNARRPPVRTAPRRCATCVRGNSPRDHQGSATSRSGGRATSSPKMPASSR